MKGVVVVATLLGLLGVRSNGHLFKNLYKSMNRTLSPPLNADIDDPLILTPYLKEGRYEEAQKAALVQHSSFYDIESYAALFTVDEEYDSNLWFWFFPSSQNVAEDPVVLWLNGGPGATSMYGLFDELGPYVVAADGTVTLREYSWHNGQSVLFIDQPVGVGYSYTNGGLPTNETKVGADMYSALLQFFQLFPNLQQNEFYISGESYAGHYLPAIGYTIHQNNPTADQKINLQGILIGDGWTDPINQQDYGKFVYNTGLVSAEIKEQVDNYRDLAVAAIEKEDWSAAVQHSDYQFDLIMETSLVNVYNIIEDYDDPEKWADLLNTESWRNALHAGATLWGDKGAGDALEYDIPQTVAPWLEVLLNNYRVLLFTGQVDLICGYPMQLDYITKLSFDGATEYKQNTRYPWYVDDDLAGYVRTGGNLVELLVRNSGHMVPRDQPKWAMDMIYRFTRNLTFA